MARFLLFGFFLHPFLSAGQVVDTAALRVEVDSLANLANFHHNKAEYNIAEPLYLEAITIREKVLGKENADYAGNLNSLANLYNNTGKYDKAETLYLEALFIWRRVLGKENQSYAKCLRGLATLYARRGEYEKSELFYMEARVIYEKVVGKQHLSYATTLHSQGVLHKDKGEYDKAESLFLESKAIREKLLGKESQQYAFSLDDLGGLYMYKGIYDKAEVLLLEAKMIMERVLGKENPDYAINTSNLARLYWYQGKYDKSESLFLEAIGIQEKVLGKGHPYYAQNVHALALLYRDKREFNRAESLFLDAKTIREKVLGKESLEYAFSLDDLASLYMYKGDYNKAEPLCMEAKTVMEKAIGKENLDYAINLNNLARLNLYKEEYEKAAHLFLEAKTIVEKVLGKLNPNYAISLNYLAILYRDLGQPKKSEPYFTEATFIHKSILQKSATYLSTHELEKYIVLYQDKNEVFYAFNHQTTSDTFRIASYNNALFYKGFALEMATRLEQAMQNAPDSIRDIHSRWKGYNRRLASELALPLAERKHAVYLDSMSNLLEKGLLRATPAFAEAQRQVEWQEVRDALQPGEAAIEFIHYRYSDKKETDSTMYSALVTMPGLKAPQFIPLCEARQLDALIYKPNGTRANYLQNLYDSPRKDGLPSLNQLLWAPIEKVLRQQGVKTVYYSPAGLLHRLNLGAISEGKSGVPLAEHYHLVPTGSTRQLTTIQSTEWPIKLSDALIYGGVRYEMDSSAVTKANTTLGATAQDTTGGLFGFSDQTGVQRGENWDYLPGTEQEARYLDNLLHKRGINTNMRLGYEATEESFKQIGQNGPSPSLLHIGTHGFFFPDPQDTSRRRAALNGDEPIFKISEYSMIRSGLKLAGSRYAWENGHPLPGGHEDGILTAYEVSQMNLSNTQLVVLSACETGLGDIRGNEGVYGLQRAFRIAGAKNVLMSLWKVPDEATEKLMTRFYSNWLSEKKSLRASFEEAQKWLRGQKGFENPYYWAGFVLVGEL